MKMEEARELEVSLLVAEAVVEGGQQDLSEWMDLESCWVARCVRFASTEARCCCWSWWCCCRSDAAPTAAASDGAAATAAFVAYAVLVN